MTYGFLDIGSTPSVRAAQAANGSAEYWAGFNGDRTSDRFGEAERAFIGLQDRFYIATVSESGWPYVQHRGGPPGFLRSGKATLLYDAHDTEHNNAAALVEYLRSR